MESVYCAVRARALYIARYHSCVSSCCVLYAKTASPQLCTPQPNSISCTAAPLLTHTHTHTHTHTQPSAVATPNSTHHQLSPPNCSLMTFSHALYTAVYIIHKITKINGVTHHIGIRNEMQILSLPHLKMSRGRHVVISGCRKLKQAGY